MAVEQQVTIMEEFKIIARILAAIRAGEEHPGFNTALVDSAVIKADDATRDRLALKLQKEGYIDGLCIIDGIDNAERPVIAWSASKPEITIKGLEYKDNSDSLKRAFAEIRSAGVAVAAQAVSNTIFNWCR